MNLGPYAKAISAAVVAGFTAAIGALADGGISPVEWTVVAGSFLVALGGVFVADNVRWFRYAKAVVAGLVAAVGALGVALTDGGGVSTAELITIAVALLSGLGLVSQVPNAEVSDYQRRDHAGRFLPRG